MSTISATSPILSGLFTTLEALGPSVWSPTDTATAVELINADQALVNQLLNMNPTTWTIVYSASSKRRADKRSAIGHL
jgi:hypothetical protein